MVAVYSFLLNYQWELFQLPLFDGFAGTPYYDVILHCTKATLGDVVISLAAFATACIATRSRRWIVDKNTVGIVTFLLMGLLITILFEILATGPLERWTYAERMPLVPFLQIGASPILQWIVLPLLMLWFVRRQILGGEAIS